MIFGLLVPGAFAAETESIEPLSFPFTDVAAGTWYRPYVQAVRDQGIMQGVTTTRFAPNDTFSRGQIIATLFRIHHNRTANVNDSRNNPFNDIGNAWYTPYVTWAHNNGISSGTSATRFGANDHVTRQEIATIMHNYVRNLTDHNSGSTATAQWNAFTDRGQITFSGAYNAFRWANNHGIVNGVTTTRLEPNGTATRAQAAAMLVRLLNFMDGSSGGGNQGGNNNNNQQQPQTPTIAQAEAEFVRLINQHRARYGLRPLVAHTQLADVARAHSTDMRVNNFFAHWSPTTGMSYRARVENAGLIPSFDQYFDPNGVRHPVTATNVGEVITTAGVPTNSAEAAVRAFLNSPGHRNAIMHPNNYFIGVGLDGVWTVKIARPLVSGLPAFVPGNPPPNTHPFNPQP